MLFVTAIDTYRDILKGLYLLLAKCNILFWITIDTVGYPFEAGEWYHIAGTLDTKSPRRQIYVNGELVAEDKAAFDMVPTTQPLQMGRKETDSTFQYVGLIDEVRVWDVVRTAEEIKQDMEGPKAVFSAHKLTATWGAIKKK